MSNVIKRECCYCGSMCETWNQSRITYYMAECPVCKRYNSSTDEQLYTTRLRDEIAAYLYYAYLEIGSCQDKFYFFGDKECYDDVYYDAPYVKYVSESELRAFYPKTFDEKIDVILNGLALKSEFLGAYLELSKEEVNSAFFIKRYVNERMLDEQQIYNQKSMIISYLKEFDYVHIGMNSEGGIKIQLTTKGWNRVDSIQKKRNNESKNVFIAMSFSEDMKEVRDAIKEAVAECNYIPRIMDEIEHNNQIVPEMLYEIKTARFVIAELTGHNNGAYFEAGYALGREKEVIQICNIDSFGEDGHFDVRQVNTVLWTDVQDLKNRLVARIRATIK